MAWKPSSDGAKFGVATCNFDGNLVANGLSLRVGETVQILEEAQDWYRGFLVKNRNVRGIFPQSFIHLLESKVENAGQFETVYPLSESVVQEVTDVLREWGIMWKKLFMERNTQMFIALKQVMLELADYRRQIMSGKLTQDQQRELKNRATQKIDWGNSKLDLDLVPRVEGEMVDSDCLSVVELYQVHVSSTENSKSTTDRDTIRRPVPHYPKGVAHHLLMTMKGFMINIGEDAVVLFSLYDSKEGIYISERYMVMMSKHGMPRDIERLNKLNAIYTDLSTADLAREVYLVCHVFREGKLLLDSKKNPLAAYRRPFGCGVVFVGDVLRGKVVTEDEKEFNISIFSCHESEFYCLEEYIIKKQTTKYSGFGSNTFSVCVGMKMLHGDLDKIMEDNPLLLNAGAATTNRLGFPEVIMPGDIRNDFYVTIDRADFEKGGKTAQRNVEVAFCVVSNKGKILTDCLQLGSGEKPISEYHSFVLYHNNDPRWNEIVKVQIPLSEFHSAHLRFTFSHCSRFEGKVKGEKVFGFAFLKLVNEDGTVIKDDSYELFVYKYDSSVSFTDVRSYLSLPTTSQELDKQKSSGVVHGGPSRNHKESFTIKTSLCSTKLTQNSELVGLLKWRLKPDDVSKVLQSVLKVNAEEFMKFLQDVFDALFNILSDKGEQCGIAVFKVLVHIICFVEDEKYNRFKPTIDSYIQEHFSAALAYKNLIQSFKQLLEKYNESSVKETLIQAMQSFPFVMKFIVRSRELHKRASSQNDEGEFQSMVKELFTTLNKIMTTKPEILMDAKILEFKRLFPLLCSARFWGQPVVRGQPNIDVNILEHFSSSTEDGLKLFSGSDFSAIVSDFINSVPKVLNSSATYLRKAKLSCIRKIVCSKLFQEESSRTGVLPTVLDHLNHHMEKKQEHHLCLEILGDIITSLQKANPAGVADDIDLLARSLLNIVLNIYLTIDRKGPLSGLTVSCLLGLLNLMEEQHYGRLLESYQDKKDLKDFLMKIVVAFKDLMTQEIFPKDWFVLRILSNNLVLTAIQYLSKAFTDHFLSGTDFDYQLWSNYFQLAVAFILQECLQLESFMENKRERIVDRYGDMRQIMGFEVVDMWEHLGSNKINFIPGLIGPFLEVTLVPEPELRKSTIPIFFDMMKVEFAEEGNFKKVETELIDKLDVLVSSGKGDSEYEELFRQLISQSLDKCGDPSLYQKGKNCVEAISQLLKRLLDYRTAVTSDDCGMDQQMMCTVRLLSFYQGLGRQDMYIRYIYKLCDLHTACENYTEAGFTLLLHAALLQWSETMLKSEQMFPDQQELERKEQLYLKIIAYFDKGKTWESGIELCKQLALIYETKLFDYLKLSDILRKQAQFYDNIMHELRPEPEYFRVTFIGQGFPEYLMGQVFVYRGLEYEKLASFTQRLRAEFPNAEVQNVIDDYAEDGGSGEVMTSNKPPDESILNSPGQYIQCCSVQPIPSDTDVFHGKIVNDKIASYYKVNQVMDFKFSRPFHKGAKDENNEFVTLWLERTMMKTREKFPGILRWSRVNSITRQELNPLQNAIDSIHSKNLELIDMISRFEKNPEANINPLSMVLNGVIDANVNGGISKYQTGFLNDDYLFLHPEEENNVNTLKNHLKDQVDILSSGLALHERISGASLRPFHDKMVAMFGKMKASIETGQPIEMFMTPPPSIGSPLERTHSFGQNSSPRIKRASQSIKPSFNFLDAEPSKHSHNSMPTLPKGFSLAGIGRKLSETFSASTPNFESLPTSPGDISKQRSHSQVDSSSGRPVSTMIPEVSVPPLPPRRTSFPTLPSAYGGSGSSLTNPAVRLASNNLGGANSYPQLAGSAPTLGHIAEDDQEEPPSLPQKRRSSGSQSALFGLKGRPQTLAVYEEVKDGNSDTFSSPTCDGIAPQNEPGNSERLRTPISETAGNVVSRERPRSLPPNSYEFIQPVPAPRDRFQPQRHVSLRQEGTQPRPKPRPRTMIIKRSGSSDNVIASDSDPVLSRVAKTGVPMLPGGLPPPVPLKRAQMYRSQERVSNSSENIDGDKK